MCSTPKPKRNTHGKSLVSAGGILSTITSKQRLEFAKRANDAHQQRTEKKQHNRKLNSIKSPTPQDTVKHKKANKNKHHNTWLYWLLSASCAELFKKIVLRH
ncbi:MAG: hypothetical protein GY787_26605 [Alteromonadales bacterium]|nr:hypothetical protein [Alteromonadales bacterium]MCP4985005.1 hypothetical protein [Colwellia sp.]